MLPLSGRAATNDLSGLLQQGLFEEEANRNLPAAIAAYESLTKAFDQDRRLAATAVFRLGECHRKLGQTNEAAASYQRILRDFADEETLATLSRQNLVGMGVRPVEVMTAPQVPPPPGTQDFERRQREILARSGMATNEIAQQLRTLPERTLRTEGDATDDEDQEIARLQAMIQHSPDLLNAPSGDPPMTPLGRAASRGQLRVARFLLDASADSDRRSPGALAMVGMVRATEAAPLHYAAASGHRAMVELLLEREAAVNVRCEEGLTPLHLAVNRGFQSVAEALLNGKAEINAPDNGGVTPLHLAGRFGHAALAAFLIQRDATVDAQDESGNTPLILAVKNRHLDTVRSLLADKAGTDLTDNAGRTALSHAAEGGHLDIVKALLAAKADPNAGKASLPLHCAIKSKSPAIVQALLKAGANPNQDPGDGRTPLWIAVEAGQAESVKALVAHGAKPEASPAGITPLIIAVDRRDHATVEALLKGGANPNARFSDNGRTALHLAVQMRDAQMTELLLAHKADVNARDQNGLTPLDYAEGRTQPSGVPTALAGPILPSPARAIGIPYQSQAPATSVAELLRQHGALGNLPAWTSIRVTRQGMGSPWVAFRADTNDWNRFTLFEALQRFYSIHGRGNMFAFPNLSELVIHRPSRTPGGEAQAIKVNLLNASNTVDCAQDRWLKFGDVIEIPQRERTLNETSDLRLSSDLSAMEDCIRKRVRLVVRNQSKDLPLTAWAYLYEALSTPDAQSLLRTSSDLSRVKVTRKDPTTGKTIEFTLNVEPRKAEADDLWLRDGDVIEVPEKE